VEAITLPSNNPDISDNAKAEDKQAAAPVDFIDEVESDVDHDSLSDVGVNKDNLTE
jgi:hypothetical protein